MFDCTNFNLNFPSIELKFWNLRIISSQLSMGFKIIWLFNQYK